MKQDRLYHDPRIHGSLLSYDLHMHSIVSDGTQTPEELLGMVAAAGVDVIALTDHDATDGFDEARQAGQALGVIVVAGAEISVTWRGRLLHILALGIDPLEPTLQAGLAGLRARRETRAQAMGERLSAKGIDGCYEAARRYAGQAAIGRTHFARELVARGLAKNKQVAFKRYLRPGKPGYVACEWATLDEAIGWINAAGGRAAIAHPARYGLSATLMRCLCAEFRDMGGSAIEVISGTHSVQDNQTAARYARDFDLMATQGSDFHGPGQSWCGLGRLSAMPTDLLPIWHDWAARGIVPFDGAAPRADTVMRALAL